LTAAKTTFSKLILKTKTPLIKQTLEDHCISLAKPWWKNQHRGRHEMENLASIIVYSHGRNSNAKVQTTCIK